MWLVQEARKETSYQPFSFFFKSYTISLLGPCANVKKFAAMLPGRSGGGQEVSTRSLSFQSVQSTIAEAGDLDSFIFQPQGAPQKTHVPITVHWSDMNISIFGIYGSCYLLLADTLLYPSELLTTRLQSDTVRTQEHLVLAPFNAILSS